MNDRFTFFASFYEAAKDLPDADRLALYDAIIKYGIDGTEPDLSGIPKMIFAVIHPILGAGTVRRSNGKLGGRPKKAEVSQEENHGFSEDKTIGFPKVESNKNIEKEIEVENEVEDRKSRAFRPPSLQEVRDYCIERKNNVDPEQWFAFYESKGWMIGKNKMKDWRAAVRTWEKRDTDKPKKKTGQFYQFQQGEYDYAEIERRLREN